VCKLKAKTSDIKIQESEIVDCKWMPLSEFKELSYSAGLHEVMHHIEKMSLDGKYSGISVQTQPLGTSCRFLE
jgi:hypothetical protein